MILWDNYRLLGIAYVVSRKQTRFGVLWDF